MPSWPRPANRVNRAREGSSPDPVTVSEWCSVFPSVPNGVLALSVTWASHERHNDSGLAKTDGQREVFKAAGDYGGISKGTF